MTTNMERRYPVDVMNEELAKVRPAEEAAPVTVPAWVAMEALSLVANACRGEAGSVEWAGRMQAVREVLRDATKAGLDRAGVPGEWGVVNGERCVVRLWPADDAWRPVRETVGRVRPVRLAGMHHYLAVTVQVGQAPRFIIDGAWVSEAEATGWFGGLANVLRELESVMLDGGGATFISAKFLQADGQTKAGGTYLGYAVVPAAADVTG